MNREVLFRGKGNPEYNDGDWYYGYLIFDGEDYQIVEPKYGSFRRTVLTERSRNPNPFRGWDEYDK